MPSLASVTETGGRAAELIAQIVAPRFDTDYVLLSVAQAWQERPDAMVFATSMPGAIGMICGSRFATVEMTVQRWSGRPPAAADEWEDIDEIPFEPIPDGGPLFVFGFDAPGHDGPELDVSGLGRCRARVCATGRRIADKVAEVDTTGERWLVQIWPDHGDGHDPMSVRPRTLRTAPPPPPDFDQLDRRAGPGDPYYSAFPAKWDVFHLLWWSPNQTLSSTPSAIAHRLGVSVDHVIGAIVSLVRHKNASCTVDPRSVGAHDQVELRR